MNKIQIPKEYQKNSLWSLYSALNIPGYNVFVDPGKEWYTIRKQHKMWSNHER